MKFNFEKVLNKVSTGIIVLDNKWRFIFANAAALRFSINKDIIGKNIWKEFPQFKNTKLEKCYRLAVKTQKPVIFDYEGSLSKKFYKFSAHPTHEGLIIFSIDITDKIIIEDNLKKALHEKELLIKEAHHRVKNNLQIISSLLNFQIKKIKNEELKNIFTDTQNRIKSISIIHKSLYHSSSLTLINVKSLMSDFIESLAVSLLPGTKSIKISKEVDEIIIHSDLAVAISLITNELVTNSIKYAFGGKKKGNISVKLKDSKDHILLTINDDGSGLPGNVDISRSEGIGFMIINSLVDQHNGSFSYRLNKGSNFKIKFPKKTKTNSLKRGRKQESGK